MVHRWGQNVAGCVARGEARQVADGFIALTLTLPPSAVPAKLPNIRIELRRGPTTVTDLPPSAVPNIRMKSGLQG